jgi:hypothetical protein
MPGADPGLRVLVKAVEALAEVTHNASVTTVCSRNAALDNSEETVRVTWHPNSKRFAALLLNSSATLTFAGAKELAQWVKAAYSTVMIVQIDSRDVHFAGEHEVATLFYNKTMRGPRRTSAAATKI